MVKIDNNNIAIWDLELVQVHKKKVLFTGKWEVIKNKLNQFKIS